MIKVCCEVRVGVPYFLVQEDHYLWLFKPTVRYGYNLIQATVRYACIFQATLRYACSIIKKKSPIFSPYMYIVSTTQYS